MSTPGGDGAAGPTTGLWCKYCGPSAPLRVEERFEADPVGSASLAGVQPKLTGRFWPYAVCDRCGRSSRGKIRPGDEKTPAQQEET